LLHPLLRRQLKKLGLGDGSAPPAAESWALIFERISRAYREADEERYTMERSLAISSREMQDLYADLKVSESRLSDERDKLRVVLDSLGDGLCTLDRDGTVLFVNPEGERLLGWRRPDIAGRYILDVAAPASSRGDGTPGLAKTLARVLSAREPERSEDGFFLRRDGSTFPAAYVLAPMFRDGEVSGLVLVFRDISERRAAQEAIEQERRQLRSIIANAPVAMAMFDRDLRYLTVSRKWLTDYGLEGRPVIGRLHYEVFPDIPDHWKESHARALAGELITVPEDVFHRADGTKMHVRRAVQPWRTSEGAIGGIVIVTDSIDDLVRARDAAYETSRLKAQFVANMSHEIRTPMNGVIGMASLIADTELSPEQREYVETIRTSAESLLSLVNDVLDFSKIEAGKIDIEAIDFDPRSVVEEVVEMLAERAQSKGLELTFLVQHDVPDVLSGDPGRLRQVLTNLLGNAIKFTERGEVTVTASFDRSAGPPGRLRFEVADTGIGIPEAARGRLFAPFSQGDGSTTRRYGGSGLGLTISKQLVDLMQGRIGFESAVGRGSRFWFVVPTGPPREQGGERIGPRKSLSGLRVLVVDDNGTNRKLLSMLLSKWGAHPVEADGGESGLETVRAAAARGAPFDLAILDHAMPTLSGVDLARVIRADRALASVRLVLLTSLIVRGQGDLAREAGFDGYLAKPIRRSRLYECLRAVMGKKSPALPAAGPPPPLVTSRSLEEAERRARLRVLLAEDNGVNQKVASTILKKIGVRVDVVENGAESVRAAAERRYDLILMDCQMPEMDGFEATRAIRAREAETGVRVPIIALTAHAMQGDRERCLESGMDDYLTKPLQRDALLAALKRWLEGV